MFPCHYGNICYNPRDHVSLEGLMSEKKVTGVAQAIDLESISKDISELIKKLDKKAEGPVDVQVLKKVQAKIEKILTPAA
jgi:hypothetical protein